jgi:transcriptional regulator
VEELTRDRESIFPEPWTMADAPADYIARLLGGIVGLEIEVSRIEGKWKVSQNQPEANRKGVIAGLEASGEARALAVAALVRERG